MKKYLGSPITAFAGLVIPLFILGPIIFASSAVLSELSTSTILIAFGCIFCSIVWFVYAKKYLPQIYSWGIFEANGVSIRLLGKEQYFIDYTKCKSVGIGLYTHGVLNSTIGSKIHYIYFSYDKFDPSFRTQMNLWLSSKTRIKVKYSSALYFHLLKVLPPKHRLALENDYKLFISGELSHK